MTHQKTPTTAGEYPAYEYEHTNHLNTFYNSHTLVCAICRQVYFVFSETFLKKFPFQLAYVPVRLSLRRGYLHSLESCLKIYTLADIGVSLGLSMNFEAVTARYVDAQPERKKEVLDAYHDVVGKTEKAEPKKTKGKAKKKSSDLEL